MTEHEIRCRRASEAETIRRDIAGPIRAIIASDLPHLRSRIAVLVMERDAALARCRQLEDREIASASPAEKVKKGVPA